MKTHKLLIFLAIIIGGVVLFAERTAENGKPLPITSASMKITSPSFNDGDNLPSKFTCDGKNISPELIFSEIPPKTKSLALIYHDPDALKHGGWTHWIIINMTPSTTGIKENGKPATGLETTTDFGKPGYGSPCPPSGSHRYIFSLYALDTILNLDQSATKDMVEKTMISHILEETSLIGVYKRQ